MKKFQKATWLHLRDLLLRPVDAQALILEV